MTTANLVCVFSFFFFFSNPTPSNKDSVVPPYVLSASLSLSLSLSLWFPIAKLLPSPDDLLRGFSCPRRPNPRRESRRRGSDGRVGVSKCSRNANCGSR
ncbi:hypothetical protein QBC32DRAFT_342057 [Pseudoneurospora amorphoporcata]|uniref:Uncharacterized protein n=1 Tax=Pseudoneurospora amorphoporcata TaxID=241081 RepID=A0AAN6SGC3_9PEZI|nr:hypothetical protein QBC32DRAFT_342057 [Pseudoneurospora amorphoporcata]